MTRHDAIRSTGGGPLPTARRTLLRAAAGAVVGAAGLPALAAVARAETSPDRVAFHDCRAAVVGAASAVARLAVYWADDLDVGAPTRHALYGVDPTVAGPRPDAPVVVTYNQDEDRARLQLLGSGRSLVAVVLEADGERTPFVNPDDGCVPPGFNTPPTAAFEVIPSEPLVGEEVTFETAFSDPDDPDRHRFGWDRDGDDEEDADGRRTTATYAAPGEVPVTHRVTDDLGATTTATTTVVVRAPYDPPDEQVATLLAADGATDDRFGAGVAATTDTALVGAPGAYGTAMSSGAAYVFDRDGERPWAQRRRLVPAGARAVDLVGSAVALDEATALLGAPFEDFDNFGAVFTFDRLSDGTWSEGATLVAPTRRMDDRFGAAVALDGDTAVVGAWMPERAGAAFAYERDAGGTWGPAERLRPAGAATGDEVGRAVDVAGDLAVVGAPGASAGGATTVFERSGGGWSEAAMLAAPTGVVRFGAAAGVDGGRAVVGDPEAGGTGAVHLYDRGPDGDWGSPTTLAPDGLAVGDRFGASVSLDGEVLVVGAPGDDERAEDAGAAHVFTRGAGGSWRLHGTLRASEPGEGTSPAGDGFGRAVAVRDGLAVVGAPGDDALGTDAGGAFVFE